MIEIIKRLDEKLDELLSNGMNHALYASIIIFGCYFSLGWFVALVVYIVLIVIFYGLEVWQAMSRQSAPLKLAVQFWIWHKSKIEDVVGVVVIGGSLVGVLFFV